MRSGWLLPRHPGDVVRICLAVAALAATAVFVHRDRVGLLETNTFRLVNDLPAALFPFVWPVMQVGNIVAVPIAAAAAAATRRYRLAVEIAAAGAGVWLLAKVVKTLVVRGRPATLLPDVHIHGAPALGHGYLSCHAAVATAMVTLLAPYLGRRAHRALLVIVVVVCVARVYVGAHLPLDVIGGAALGWGAASAVHLLFGAPSGRPSPRGLRRALAERGWGPVTIEPIDPDFLRSARFAVTTADGRRLFAKVVPRERRDRDLLYRAWLWLRRDRSARARLSPSEQATHEALMGSLAAAAGVRTPRLLEVGTYANGAGLLVQEWVDASRLDHTPVDDELREQVSREVALLHEAGIAHRDLTPANVLVDTERRPWLVDFDRAAPRAAPDVLAAEASALRTAVAALGPPARPDVLLPGPRHAAEREGSAEP